ncbi:MAG TPA: hypothetical protein VN929_17110 [Burkholderiales bacterium]|nr:hypothetical protein [Burkholderiales bacterium]
MAQPADFLAQAIELLKTAGNDLDYRLVIDRAYYGAYHAARQFEEALPHRSQVTTDKTGSHDGLFQRLECPNPKLDYGLKVISQDVGAQMRMLKPLRELASYELQETIRVEQAEQAIEGAKDVIAECAKGRKKLAAGPSK